ncbi:MAG: amino acid adenylation domain-containing protein [Calditrichaceae bacterium]
MKNIQNIYPLSPMQQGMLFHTLLSPETEVYSEQLSCIISGELLLEAFRQAWEKVIERQDILRSSFIWEDLDEPLQVVHKNVSLNFRVLDWTEHDTKNTDKMIRDVTADDRKNRIDLSLAPLMNITLIRLSTDRSCFIWNYHHLLFDGWGLGIILKEVFTLYEALSKNRKVTLEPVYPYSDYIAWLKARDIEEAKQFWKKLLNGFTNTALLGISKRKQSAETGYAKKSLTLSEKLSESLSAFSKANKFTLNTLFQGAWTILLSRYSNNDDVVFGITVSGRPADLTGVESMVGLFINTVPIRIQLKAAEKILKLLENVQFTHSELLQYDFTPLVEIQSVSEIPRGSQLFESIMVFENYPIDDSLINQESSIRIESVQSFERTNYPITLVISPGKLIGIDLAYEEKFFDENIIDRMFEHLVLVLENICENPELKIGDLNILSKKERSLLLQAWNQSKKPYPDTRTIPKWFEEQVKITPDKQAIVFENETLTYDELNRKANQVARFLIKKGVSPEKLVGICMNKSTQMIIAILGILKAGGAYVPIDPDYPAERINFMIKDSGLKILITDQTPPSGTDINRLTIIDIDEEIDDMPAENPEPILLPHHLAYIIYTSGSTGQPKGVLLQHQGLCNFVQAMANKLSIDNNSNILQFSSLSFDASVAEIFIALLSGATLFLARKEVFLSPESLDEFAEKHNITFATLPPSLLSAVPPDMLKTVRTLVSVGDSCSWDLAKRWHTDHEFINGYGPTEVTIGSVLYKVDDLDADSQTVPIGKPLDNTLLYLLDKNMNPVPIGCTGEIFLGGPGIARGYHNRADLTAEKFLPDPFHGNHGGRLYRTGDLGRFLSDGNIEFMGRVDFQVKLRGFRVELEEIESALKRIESVNDATVIIREDMEGDKRITAYIIPEKATDFLVSEIREKLKNWLAEFMIPSVFVRLDKFPLNSSGKIDRKALPAPEKSDFIESGSFVAPANQNEEILAGIFADILGLEKVGRTNSFFELGGHSLMATQAVSRIRDAFKTDIPLRILFEHPVISDLAEALSEISVKNSSSAAPPLAPTERKAGIPLSFAQQRLWFLDQLEPGNIFYNIPSALVLKGRLDLNALEKSVQTIISRHESLRTVFKTIDGKPEQIILQDSKFRLKAVDLSSIDEPVKSQQAKDLATKEAKKSFDLTSGPLFRVLIIKLSEQSHLSVFALHHIIADGWSVKLLIDEIAVCYDAYTSGHEPLLSDLPVQYADFAQWQQGWLKDDVLEQQIAYWKEKLGGSPPLLELPTDRPRPAVQTFNGATETIEISEDLTGKLIKLSRRENCTLFMTLLAAFQTLLHRYSRQKTILVGSPIANRTHPEIERLIGFFVNTLVFRADFDDDPDFIELMKQIRETALKAYSYQDLPFEKLVEELHPTRDMSHSPLFQVAFVLQNLPVSSIELSDLVITPYETETITSKYDMTLTMIEGEAGLLGIMEYNTDLFNSETVKNMLDHFKTLLTSVALDPSYPVGSLQLLTTKDTQQITNQWNQTKSEFPAEICVHEWFELNAKKQPDAPAVIFRANSDSGSEQLTYSELNSRSNRLARYLLNLDIGVEKPVGICMDRSIDMIVAILAVLKSGNAFLPIDPAYPADRIAYMVEDSGLPVVIAQERTRGMLPAETKSIVIDRELSEINTENDDNPAVTIDPDNLAYIIYTSGSTGRPKGTMLRHRGLCNLASTQIKEFDVGKDSKIMQFSSLSFDASVWEFTMALLCGAAICLTSRETIVDGNALVKLLRDEQITTITLPPSVLAVLPETPLPDLRVIITAGEAVSGELVERWRKGRKFFNAYGPTETTVCASMHLCSGKYPSGPPIGMPISNFKIFILDEYKQPVPMGVPGELCIAGVGLARGYLNRPGQTAEKFIPNPFSEEPGDRLYCSGDLARYLPDGNIGFMGRIDQQVKIRGFRIELGEIESVLKLHKDISDVVVIARDDLPGSKALAAYFVVKEDKNLEIPEILTYLRERLPDYMIPPSILKLDRLPLTPNGKIDRKALPAPSGISDHLESEYVAPRNETELKVVEIVGQLLNREKVGINDNFFDLGGHSLLATQFLSRLRERFKVELPLRVLFEQPTSAGIAGAIMKTLETQGEQESDTPVIKRVSRTAVTMKKSDLA